jgi:hypothetical protein
MELVPAAFDRAAVRHGVGRQSHHCKEVVVGPLVSLGILLIVFWAVLWLGFHIVGWVIHLLIIIGIILLVWGLIKRGARAVDRHI